MSCPNFFKEKDLRFVLNILDFCSNFLSEIFELLHSLSNPGTGSLIFFIVELFKIPF